MTVEGIGFIGAGNMAEAWIRGLAKTGDDVRGGLRAYDPRRERLHLLRESYGVTPAEGNRELAAACRMLVLAVKPQQAAHVLAEIRTVLAPDRHVLVSIAAGLSTDYLETCLRRPLPIIRVMPNTPAQLQCGASAFCRGRHAGDEVAAEVKKLLAAVGWAVEVQEDAMDAVTALSGSGPAYVFRLCELMIVAGMELGLTREHAEGLSTRTVLGAARMLVETGRGAGELRAAVTSAGGTTEAALRYLDENDFEKIFTTALSRARDRARALAPKPEV